LRYPTYREGLRALFEEQNPSLRATGSGPKWPAR
jgi:hypothetical protein